MLAKLKEFIKVYQADIILVIGVILISLFSFLMGYIVAKQSEKQPIQIEQHDTNIRIAHQCYEYSYNWS